MYDEFRANRSKLSICIKKTDTEGFNYMYIEFDIMQKVLKFAL